MPVSVETVQQIVHPTTLGGNQGESKIATFADGSFVVAWQSVGLGLTTFLQRFTADGVASGAAVNAGDIGGLGDVIATNDGRFAVVGTNDTSMNIRTFDAATMTQTSSQSLGFLAEITGAQLVAQAGGNFGVAVTQLNSVRAFGVVNTSGQIVTSFVNGGAASGGVIEAVAGGSAGAIFTLESSVMASSAGSVLAVPGFQALDMLRISDGFYVIAQTSTANNNILLTGLSQEGQIDVIGTYGFSGTVTGSNVSGIAGTGQTVTAAELVDLGAGRILIAFASFRGAAVTSPVATSGIYGQVYNLNTGGPEGTATLIQSMATLSDLQQVRLQGSVMADGRVAVAITRPQGLTGLDVFRTILDPRDAGVTVAATSGSDMFVGSAFDDSFTGVGNGDTIVGGTGSDTVVFDGNASRQIDLANPAAFGPATVTLSQIENLVAGNGADTLLGNASANALSGGAGGDLLMGREGDDSLFGGLGLDTLDGGSGNDVLDGGGGNDLAMGGLGADHLTGGDGNDTLFGNAGADTLEGGEGNDLLSGGLDNDVLHGGAGNDTIDATQGTDTVIGDNGDDLVLLSGDSDAVVDGGAGIDTVSYARSVVSVFGIGVYADLAGVIDALATESGFSADSATLLRVENLRGTQGADFLAGTEGGNNLRGLGGADVLLGRGGNDTMIGGAGADVFLFENASGGNDRIRDFTPGEDRIGLVLDGFGDIDASTIAARLVANSNATPAANGNAQILFDTAGPGAGRLFFDADGNGAGAAVLFATLQFTVPGGLTSFGAADFVFF